MTNLNSNRALLPDHPVLLFDGVCNLCNGFIQFNIKHDHKRIFRYASLQSGYARQLMQITSRAAPTLDTVILIDEKGRYFEKSDVVLEIFRRFGGIWQLLYVLRIIPAGIRHVVYDFIAKNRYRFFGKKDTCMIPSPELKSLFYS